MGVPEKKTGGYRERCSHQRSAYQKQLADVKHSGKLLVYVNETGFRADCISRYAYAPQRQQVLGLISGQPARTTTLVAVRIDNTFTAAQLYQGSCNAERFNQWLGDQLCGRIGSNHVVIMDNARIDKTSKTQALIEASGASLMFLPPYSPDHNPIEHDFANIKRSREYQPQDSIEQIMQMYQ